MSPLTPHFTLDRNEILALLTFWKTIVHWQFRECLPYIDPTKFSISIDECNTLAAKSLFTLDAARPLTPRSPRLQIYASPKAAGFIVM